MTFKHLVVALVCLGLASAFISGCSQKPTTSSDKLTIAVIPKGTTHEFWKSVHAGAKAAADELGVEIIWKGPQREDDREQQISVVDNFISMKVSGIVLAPLDDSALRTPVENAANAGRKADGRASRGERPHCCASLSGRVCQHHEPGTGLSGCN